jgi:ribosomal-protein-alanine N-acetyltransferase
MVAQRDGRIQGFMIYHLHRHHLELETIAVHPVYQRESVGRQVVAKLIQKLSPQRRTRIVTDVRESNLPAQLFFRTMGFKATSVLRNHYEQNDESAYRFEFRI